MRFAQADNSREDLLIELRQTQMPVGYIFETDNPANPATYFGFGTWVLHGVGRATVCVDAADPDIDAAGKTLGAKEINLTQGQLPVHGHVVNDPGHTHVENSNNTSTGGLRGWGAPDTSTNNSTATGYSTASATTGITVSNTGNGDPVSVVQPSIATYRWKRTA